MCVFSSVQDGIYALGKAHMRSIPSFRNVPNVCVCVCVYTFRIVHPGEILCCTNTFIVMMMMVVMMMMMKMMMMMMMMITHLWGTLCFWAHCNSATNLALARLKA